MLPILVGVGAVALAGLLLEGCGDGNEKSDDASVSPSPGPNTNPVLSLPGNATVHREVENEIPFSASDADGDSLNVFISGNPSSAQFQLRVLESRPGLVRGVLAWIPTCSWNAGNTSIRIAASDNRGGIVGQNINLAVTNLIVSGGGVYNISQSLTLCRGTYSGVRFNVRGNDVSLDGGGSTIRDVAMSGSSARSVISIEDGTGVNVSNFNILNNGSNAASMVRFNNCNHSTVENLNVDAGFREGLGIYGSRDVSGSNITINTRGDLALSIGNSSMVRLERMAIAGFGTGPDTGIRFGLIHLLDSNNISVTDSRISRSVNPGISAIYFQNTNTSSLRSSEIFLNNGGGIALDSNSRFNLISGCNIHDNEYGINLSARDSRGDPVYLNGIIENNRFSNNRAGNYNADAVSGNTFRNNMPPP